MDVIVCVINIYCYQGNRQRVGGNIQIDWTYVTILPGKHKTGVLYKEPPCKFGPMQNQKNLSVVTKVYTITEESAYILETMAVIRLAKKGGAQNDNGNCGTSSMHRNGASITLISPAKQVFLRSQKFNFECTNNVVEYEGLLLGYSQCCKKNWARQGLKNGSKESDIFLVDKS